MKKFLIFLFLTIALPLNAQTLRGGVSEEYIPKGFYGSWGVISKLKNTNNPIMFNKESRDIWTLSGYDNILILENLETGAKSEIRIKEKTQDGKTLKFERKKITNNENDKTVYREIVTFSLLGKNFSGNDKFIVEKYNKNNVLLEKNEANYAIEGVKISGSKPH